MEEIEVTENRTSLAEKVKDGLKYHIVDSTALMAFSTPVFAAFETSCAGMSNETSLNARLLAVGLTYAGMGRLFSKGLDVSRKLFKIKPETKEKMKQLHDAAYATAYNLVICPPFYYAAGVRDPEQIALGTAAGMGFALVVGGPMGYAVDAFRDLTGLKESERLPELVNKQNSRVKKGLAALLVGGAIALTAGIYSSTPNKNDSQYGPPTTQQVEVRNSR